MPDAPADDRDYIGYGDDLPHAQWPGGARIALNDNLWRCCIN